MSRWTKVVCEAFWAGDRRGWAPISVMLTWGFFVAMLALIASGGALYFGICAGHTAVMVHWYATWLLLAFTGLHVLVHYRLGGSSQLLRIFRPQGLPAPPAKLDAVELLTLLVEQSERLAPEAETDSAAASQASLQPAQPSGPVSFGRAESRPHAGSYRPKSDTAPHRASAKPDPPIQSVRGRRSDGHHLRLGRRRLRLAGRRQPDRSTASPQPTRRSSTATPPIGFGETSNRFRS